MCEYWRQTHNATACRAPPPSAIHADTNASATDNTTICASRPDTRHKLLYNLAPRRTCYCTVLRHYLLRDTMSCTRFFRLPDSSTMCAHVCGIRNQHTRCTCFSRPEACTFSLRYQNFTQSWHFKRHSEAMGDAIKMSRDTITVVQSQRPAVTMCVLLRPHRTHSVFF